MRAGGLARDILTAQAAHIEGDPLQFLEVTEAYWKVGWGEGKGEGGNMGSGVRSTGAPDRMLTSGGPLPARTLAPAPCCSMLPLRMLLAVPPLRWCSKHARCSKHHARTHARTHARQVPAGMRQAGGDEGDGAPPLP